MTQGRPENDANGPTPLDGRLEAWRLVFDQRALPLPTLRPVVIGSDARAGMQISHGSILPFHVQLSKKGPAFFLKALDDKGEVRVDGKLMREAHLLGGEVLQIGLLTVRIERAEVAANIRVGAVAPLAMHQEYYAAIRRELMRAPWFLISLAFHVLLLMLANSMLEQTKRESRAHRIFASIDSVDDAIPLTEESVPTDLKPELAEEPRDLPDPVFEDPTLDDVPEGDEEEPIDMINLGDLRDMGLGKGGAQESGGFGGTGISLGRVDGPLRGRLQQFRSRGVDIVFLVDTTSSMEPFLNTAKRTCDRIITDLTDLIPNMRLGVIAYRDRGEAYVTRPMALGSDRYAILNFLESLQTAGGGDAPEAVLDAVVYGLDSMEWRQDADRVMLLVADAPPHPEDMGKLRLRLKSASRSSKGETVLSVIYTGSDYAGTDKGESVLREVAAAGNGEFSRLEDMGQVVSQIIGMTLGSQYRNSAEKLLAQRRDSSRAMLVAAKVRERNIDWLMKKMHFFPVDPSIVEGLVGIGSPAVAVRCMDFVTDPRTLRPSKEAALYVLRRITQYRGEINFDRALTTQADEMQALKRALEKTYRSR